MSSVNENTCAEQGRSIPDGWLETTLGEVINIIGGGTPKTKIPEYWDGEIPWLSVVDFNNDNRWVSTTEKSITELGLNKSSTKLLNVGDIIISARGTVGAMAQLKREMAFNQSCYGIREVEDVSDKDFLFYLTKNSLKQINRNTYGAVFDTITTKTFDVININLPPLREQKAIANILTAFDDKIENLQAQNNTLEQTAQTIFAAWFGKYQVDDELPDGWRVGNLGEVTKSVGGTTPSTKHEGFWNGNIFWSSPKDLSNNEYIYLLSTEKKITENGLKKISSGLLPKNTLLLSSRAPVGYLALTNVELAINQGYIAILPSQYFSNYYTFLWLKKNMKKVINAANGSTFLEISKSAFRTIDCVIPEKSKIEDFDKIVAPFFKKTLSNQIQIQTLKQTRDTVLPKLMSGQLRVNAFKA